VAKLGPERATLVRFNELVEDPEGVLTEILARLGLAYHPGMVEPERRKKDPVLDPSRQWDHHRRLAEPIDPGRAEAGDEIPPWAAEIVTEVAGSALTECGFEIRPGPCSLREGLLLRFERWRSGKSIESAVANRVCQVRSGPTRQGEGNQQGAR
jgi:hypothetical protein